MREYGKPSRIKVDLTGLVFGRLIVIRLLGAYKHQLYWECLCECGRIVEKRTAPLRSGNTISCGCAKSDLMLSINSSRITHGMSNTRTYAAWSNMMRRVYDPSDTHYHRYGARGIVVEDRFHKFLEFVHYMGECPQGLTLERKNNDSGYITGNMVWATQYDQQRNKSTNIIVHLGDRKLIASDAAKELDMSVDKFLSRYHKGMPIDAIASVPHNTKAVVMFNGVATSLTHICTEHELPYQRIWARINRQGLTPEEAIRRG